jgi:hypothetical protein
VNADEQRQFVAFVEAVLALQEAESLWGPDDPTVLQRKERLFQMAHTFVLVRETDVEPGPHLTVVEGGIKPNDDTLKIDGP